MNYEKFIQFFTYASESQSLRIALALALLAVVSSAPAAGYSGADLYDDCSVLVAAAPKSAQANPALVAMETTTITACGSFIEGFMQAMAFAEQVGHTRYLCTNGASVQDLAVAFVRSVRENKPDFASQPGPVFFNAIHRSYPCDAPRKESP